MVPASADARWVASWTAAPHPPFATTGQFAAESFENVTLSMVVRITQGGERLRVRFSNRYGKRPLKIGAARVFLIDRRNKPVPGSSRILTFSGATSATIPIGAPFTSDSIALDVPDQSRLRVEFYIPEATGLCTCHLAGQDELAVSPPGNFVGQVFEPVELKQFRAFLTGIDVDSADTLGTIVVVGDSITDGVGSTPGANARWPDILADRLHAAGMNWAVANAAIGGNRVLTRGTSESALARFDEDVLSLPNVEYIVLFEGVNDIGNRYGRGSISADATATENDDKSIDADQVIAGLRQLIARAHLQGIRVIVSPIGPYMGARYWSEEGEVAREKINAWILNSSEFDGVIRLDTAFADPADPRQLRPSYDAGDHLHSNDAGYRSAGEAIDLRLFQPN